LTNSLKPKKLLYKKKFSRKKIRNEFLFVLPYSTFSYRGMTYMWRWSWTACSEFLIANKTATLIENIILFNVSAYALVGLPDHWKSFQGHFVVLW